MTRPESPSVGLPNWPVLVISVGAVAGARDSRLRILKALKKLARSSRPAFSPKMREAGNLKFLPKDKSMAVEPGPVKMLRQRQPGPKVPGGTGFAAPGKLAAGLGNT